MRPICDYAERELKQDPETDPCLISGWDEERLRRIVSKQKAAVAKAKRMNLKKPLPQILCVIDDLADNARVVRGDLLSSIYISGRHYGMHCWICTQRYRMLSPTLRTQANALVFFRVRNLKDVQAFEEENSALVDQKTLHAMYEQATREPYSFLYLNLMISEPSEFAFRKFEVRLVPNE